MGRGRSSSPSQRKGVTRRGSPHSSPSHRYNKSRYSPGWGDRQEGDNVGDKGKEKLQADYRPLGFLKAGSLQKRGVPLKYSEPTDAAKPIQRWRLHVFKGDSQLRVIHLGERSCYRFGRDPAVSDVLIEHESCSKQHAVIQHRQVTIDHGYGNYATSNRPYLIDLESTHGTFLNGKRIEPSRFIQLLPKDVIRFAGSTREYVFLVEE